MKRTVLAAAAILSVGTLSACSTISEEACLAGSWEDVGFKDGAAGNSRSKLADVVETCQQYGATVDRTLYLRGFEAGIVRYCNGSNGYNSGRSGSSPNQECEVGGFDDYLDGYDVGISEYRAYSERDSLVSRWEDRKADYDHIQTMLKNPVISAVDKESLREQVARKKMEMDDLRVDIRVLEELNRLDRWSPSYD